jgi:hypothetical protein
MGVAEIDITMHENGDIALQCHQTLHGYGDGHELLASSINLPRDIRSTMLVLTDLSGPSVVTGFREYCTGYPLRSENLYALSRTWYATEMPRPGCVWTHTLLLPLEKLRRIRDMTILQRAFSRPSQEDRRTGFRRYANPMTITLESTPELDPIVEFQPKLLIRILDALYAKPLSQVIVAADDAHQLERVVFAIWSQQWPSLREEFSFCTGSLGRRSSADLPFDLQVVPQSLIRRFASIGESKSIQVASEAEGTDEIGEWATIAAADLQSNTGTQLRVFLWTFGSEEAGNRAAFGGLCRIYHLLQFAERNDQRIFRLVEELAATYSEPSSGSNLKTTIFGYPNGAIGGVESTPEEQFSVAIALLSAPSAFGTEVLRPSERAYSIVRASPSKALELGSRLLGVDTVGDEFISTLAQVLEPDDVCRSNVNEAMILRLVRANPLLATSSLVWSVSKERQIALVQNLKASPNVAASVILSIVKASLDGGADLFLTQDLTEDDINIRVGAFMEWLSEPNRPNAMSVLSQSKRLLIGHDAEVTSWLERHPYAPVAAFQAATLILNASVHVDKLGSRFWSNASQFTFKDMEGSDALRTASFVLRKALECSDVAAASNIAGPFSLLYEAAAADQMPEEAWSILSIVLPGSWWDWDRCDRMIKAVTEKFARSNWPVQQFVRTFESRKVLKRALRTVKWSWEANWYFDEICRAFNSGTLNVSNGQAEVLRSFC